MYLNPIGPLRPDLVSSYRRVAGAVGPTGEQAGTIEQLYSNLPAFVDHATRGVSDRLEFVPATGEQVAQTDTCYVDGLMPAQFPPGWSAGDSFTYQGVAYLIDYDGRGAFPDIQPYDVVTRGSDNYLVLQATRYTDAQPLLILHLNFGRAWPLTAPA